MERLIWDDKEYSIGIRILDEQHKTLVNIINGLQDVVEGSSPKKVEQLDRALGELQLYASRHFVVEEEFMRVFQYTDEDARKQLDDHHVFTERVNEWRRAPDYDTPLNLVRYLNLWLYNHILWKDKDLGVFLAEKGQK